MLFQRVCRISDIGKPIDTMSQFATVKKFCLFGFSAPNDSPLPFLPLLYAAMEDTIPVLIHKPGCDHSSPQRMHNERFLAIPPLVRYQETRPRPAEIRTRCNIGGEHQQRRKPPPASSVAGLFVRFHYRLLGRTTGFTPGGFLPSPCKLWFGLPL